MTGKAVVRPPSPVYHAPHRTTEYKFQKLEVYQLGLDFVDSVYELTNELPDSERFLRSQLERAATSIGLNISEGSTGQTAHGTESVLGNGSALLFGNGRLYGFS